MSAIAGIINFNKEPINSGYSRNMMKSLEKFPADDVRVFQKDNVFLGCHAQWITPESIGEPLPFYDSERQCVITADAIIDNREELFDKLDVEKTKRKTMPDSQLILLTYYKWGEDCPKHLIGDFAFMIWDEREQKLFGARDISGYRTLYYYQTQTSFAFSTTIEPLFTLPFVKKHLNEEWLAEYLAISGTIDTVDALLTPYKNINQIPPAHIFSLSKGRFKLTRYGTFYTGERLKFKRDEEYVEAFQEIFQQAVTARLRTHRNVGSQLSGGLDSGAVVGFARRSLKQQNKTLYTFSYHPSSDFNDFTPKQYMPDERPLIKETVKFVGGISDHYKNYDGTSSYTDIDDMLEVMEMPYKFFENSFWLKGMFEQAQKQNVGVLLNGDRGNFTISWGDAIDYYGKLLKKMKWFLLIKELEQFSKNIGGPRLRALPLITRTAFPFLARNTNQKISKHPVLVNKEFALRTGVFGKLDKYGIDQTGWLPSSGSNDEHRRILLENIFPWNAGNTLTTKLSLRYSLWKRDPTNDLRVVRYCLSIPDDQYVRNGLDRALIRRSTKGYLPDQVRLNQKIRGVQSADWVHRMIPHWNAFVEEAKKVGTDKQILEFFDENMLRDATAKVTREARPEWDTDSDYRSLMRTVIVYRFMKNFF